MTHRNIFKAALVITTAALCACGNAETKVSAEKEAKVDNTLISVAHPYPEMEEAARNGNAMAQFNMGVLFDEGEEVAENDEVAVSWYKMAAEQDFAPAIMSLGEMYQKGYGVEKDFDKAMSLYQEAAVMGNVEAQLTLGIIYQSERTGPYNEELSARMFRAAADQGNVLGMTRIGAKYADGRGVERDYIQGYMWSYLAAKYGSKEAEINMEKIAGVIEEADVTKAIEKANTCLDSGLVKCD